MLVSQIREAVTLPEAMAIPLSWSQADLAAQEKTPVLQGSATGCEAVQPGRVPKRGLEPPREINPTRS